MDPTKKRKIDENGVGAGDGDVAPFLTPDDARKMIEQCHFSQEQLIDILKDAVARHPDVLDAVRSVADPDTTKRKLFIRGLGWDTTTDGLRALFSSYGELEEAVVILDKATGKSKGYGFVTFKHVDGALLALKEPSKKIDGRVTVTQLAAAGNQGNNVNPVDVSMRKIYVANVPYDMPADKLLALFSSYGEIEEGPLGFDKATGKSRGFALFVYKTAEGAQAALVEPVKTIDGKQLNCKLAIEGKKKPGQAGPTGPGGVQAPAGGPGDGHGDGMGMGMVPQSSMPGSMAGQYGGPGGPAGMGSYGGFSGALQGPPPMGHHLNPSSLGGPGLSSVGSQAPSSLGGVAGYGAGLGGPYSGYGGAVSAGYGGLGGASAGGLGTATGGLGGTGAGLGGAGTGSSMYRMPSGSTGMPSGGYPDGAPYNLSSSSAYASQHTQAAGASPVPRVPPAGGMYPNAPPYY